MESLEKKCGVKKTRSLYQMSQSDLESNQHDKRTKDDRQQGNIVDSIISPNYAIPRGIGIGWLGLL